MEYFIQAPDFGVDCSSEKVSRVANYYQIVYRCLPRNTRRFCLYCIPQTDSIVYAACFKNRLDSIVKRINDGVFPREEVASLPMLQELLENKSCGDYLEGAIAELNSARTDDTYFCAVSVVPEGFVNLSAPLDANLEDTRSFAQNLLQRANELHVQLHWYEQSTT